jgi:hypothetical protein
MEFEELAPGWEVWSVESTRMVLTYRPDVFDSEAFPAPCLPTIYVTKGKRGRRPGRDRPSADDPWYVTLYLEPEVDGDKREYDSREAARAGAAGLAAAFARGEVDYRSLYQVPRPEYLSRLDELTGDADSEHRSAD